MTLDVTAFWGMQLGDSKGESRCCRPNSDALKEPRWCVASGLSPVRGWSSDQVDNARTVHLLPGAGSIETLEGGLAGSAAPVTWNPDLCYPVVYLTLDLGTEVGRAKGEQQRPQPRREDLHLAMSNSVEPVFQLIASNRRVPGRSPCAQPLVRETIRGRDHHGPCVTARRLAISTL